MGFLSNFRANPSAKGKPLPGPGGMPIIGSSAQLNAHKKIWDGFSELHEKYGNLVGIQIGSIYCLLVNTAELMKEILVTKANSFANRPNFLRFNSIFRGDRNLSIALCDWNTKHKTHREVLFSPLHPKNGACFQKKLITSIDEQMTKLLQRLESNAGNAMECRQEILCAVGNIFYDFVLSTTFDWDDKDFVQCTQLYTEVFQELFQGHAIDFMPWLKPFYRKRINELYSLEATLSRFTEKTSRLREESFSEEHLESPRDIADILFAQLRNQEANSDGNLSPLDVDIIIGDVIGGFPVVSNMLLWGLWMIADEPTVQDKIYEEYINIVGTGIPNGEHKKQLVYSDAAMYEILRMVSSPIIPHVAVEDTEIGGYHVPRDTMVMFHTCDTNFSTEMWEEPFKFKPERFIKDEKLHKPDHFLPFSTGKRSCLGDGLVRHVVHLFVCSIFGKFKVKLGPNTKPVDYREARGAVLMESEPELIFEVRT